MRKFKVLTGKPSVPLHPSIPIIPGGPGGPLWPKNWVKSLNKCSSKNYHIMISIFVKKKRFKIDLLTFII